MEEFARPRRTVCNDKLNAAVGLQTFIGDQYAKRWRAFRAAALIGAAPVLVSGLTRGAVKE